MTSEPLKPATAAPENLDRRGALARLLQLAAGLLGLNTLAGCPGGKRTGKYGSAQAVSAYSDSYVVLMRDVPLNVGYELMLNGREAILIHTSSSGDDIWVAVDRRCTHAGCRLYWDANGEQLVCPCHGSKFDAQGLPISGPARRPLKTWPVRLANGKATIETGKATPE